MLNTSLILPKGFDCKCLKIVTAIKGIRWNSIYTPDHYPNNCKYLGIPATQVPEMLPYNNDLLLVFDKSFCNYNFLSESVRNGCHLFIQDTSLLSFSDKKELSVLSSEGGTAIQVRNDFLYQPLVKRSGPLLGDSKFTDIRQFSCNSDSSINNLLYNNLSLIKKYIEFPVSKIDVAGVTGISDNVNALNLRIEFTNGSVAILTVSPECSFAQHSITLFVNDRIITADFISQRLILKENRKECISEIKPEKCLEMQINKLTSNIASRSEVSFSIENDLEVHQLMQKTFDKLKLKSIAP